MLHELERLVASYDEGSLSRRQLLQRLFALGIGRYASDPVAGGVMSQGQAQPLFHTRTLNHVTLYASSVARSKAFYQRITNLPIQAEDQDFCEFRLEGGFLGIYAREAGNRALKAAVPNAKPTLESEGQVYVQDPDGVRVQFADVSYKR